MNHALKTHPSSFEPILRGEKLFEFRKNDRCFQSGDWLTLREVEASDAAKLTGRDILAKVSYVLRGPDFGVPLGYCVMSLDPKMIRTLSGSGGGK